MEQTTKICVVGVGGGGCNAVDTMIRENIIGDNVTFIACNTDMQALDKSAAPVKIQLGCQISNGKGAGAKSTVGSQAATESAEEISRQLEGFDMAFITAGMGGGTGTGAAPVIAEIARKLGILTVSIVTKPFEFEGTKRMVQAESGIAALGCNSDTMIVVPNANLLKTNPDLTLDEAFSLADSVLLTAVRGISNMVLQAGYINVDFADVRAIMSNRMQTRAVVGMGRGQGDHAVEDAVCAAMHSPMLDQKDINGAQGILYNIVCSRQLTISQLNAGANAIKNAVNKDAEIIFGATIDNRLENGEVIVTIVATGMPMEGDAAPEIFLGPQISMTPVPAPPMGRRTPLPEMNSGLMDPRTSLPPIITSDFSPDSSAATPFENLNETGGEQIEGDDFLPPEEDILAPATPPEDQEISKAMNLAYPRGYLVADIPTITRQKSGQTQIPTRAARFSDVDMDDLEVPTHLRKNPKR